MRKQIVVIKKFNAVKGYYAPNQRPAGMSNDKWMKPFRDLIAEVKSDQKICRDADAIMKMRP
jgi:hypothetical protein